MKTSSVHFFFWIQYRISFRNTESLWKKKLRRKKIKRKKMGLTPGGKTYGNEGKEKSPTDKRKSRSRE